MIENAQNGLQMLSIDAIVESEEIKVRKYYEEETLEGLANSFSEIGTLQPILVRPDEEGKYELILGSRRLRAAQKLNLKQIPSCIIPNIDNQQVLVMALSENLQKEDLTPFEEAWAILKLVKDYNMTMQDIAKRIGKNISMVTARLKLLNLPDAIQELVAKKKLSLTQADYVANIKSTEEQVRIAQDIVGNALADDEVKALVRKEFGRKEGPGSATASRQAAKLNGRKIALKIEWFRHYLKNAMPAVLKMSGGEMENVRIVLRDLDADVHRALEELRDAT